MSAEMALALTDLQARLIANVPQSNSLPATTQYQNAVKEAVADYGRRCPVTKVATIAVVAGTAAYALPADFVRIVQFPSLKQMAVQGGVLITGAGIIPLSNNYNERYAFRNGQLTIYPTPPYTMNRYLYYAAGFPLAEDTFTDLAEEEAAIALHKAGELILLVIADGVARHGWRYSLADESVDKTALTANLRDQAKAEREQYDLAIASRAGGTQTVQADYNSSEYGSFGGSV